MLVTIYQFTLSKIPLDFIFFFQQHCYENCKLSSTIALRATIYVSSALWTTALTLEQAKVVSVAS